MEVDHIVAIAAHKPAKAQTRANVDRAANRERMAYHARFAAAPPQRAARIAEQLRPVRTPPKLKRQPQHLAFAARKGKLGIDAEHGERLAGPGFEIRRRRSGRRDSAAGRPRGHQSKNL